MGQRDGAGPVGVDVVTQAGVAVRVCDPQQVSCGEGEKLEPADAERLCEERLETALNSTEDSKTWRVRSASVTRCVPCQSPCFNTGAAFCFLARLRTGRAMVRAVSDGT